MTNNEFSAQAASYAKKLGCEQCETFYAAVESFGVNASGGEIERYSVSREAGVSVRVSYRGREGYAYTERLEKPERLVDHAIDNAKSIETDDLHPMQKKSVYRPIERRPSALAGMSEQERIALAKRMETIALAEDPRVQRVVYCSVDFNAGGVVIENTLGLHAARKSDGSAIYVVPSVREGEEVQTGFAFRMGVEAADVEACAKEAVADALARLGGKPVESGTYRVLLRPYAVCDLLAAFSPMFSADEAQKGCSLLAGKEGQRIASPRITLTDDPFDPIAPRAFDGEGTPCRQKAVIEQGELKTLLHNLKTARKAGVESTGNASRRSAAATVGVAPSVFRVEPGGKSQTDLTTELGDGLIIADLEGLHAGVDTISGDFSLKATGMLVRGGRAVRPVSGITVAGNFISMLKDVAAVGNDLKYALPQGGYFASPSILVSRLAIAGN